MVTGMYTYPQVVYEYLLVTFVPTMTLYLAYQNNVTELK